MFSVIDITFIDILDIFVVGLIIFQIYRLIRNTAAMNIFLGIAALYVVWIIVKALKMSLLSSILGQVLGVGVIALIILFQQEIRRFLLHIGTKYVKHGKFTGGIFSRGEKGMKDRESLEEILQACQRMSDNYTGALIVLAQENSLQEIAERGDIINANINSRLIENIFFKNSPLHDGAMIIANNRIMAARCTLPNTENNSIPAHFGMRHRAAIGLTETCDAIVIVVSEETGKVSFVQNGEIKVMNSISELRLAIEKKTEKNGRK